MWIYLFPLYLFQVHLRILPSTTHTLSYNFVPLMPGNAPLPRFHIDLLRVPGLMDKYINKMLPSHIFVTVSQCKLHVGIQ